MEYIHFEKQEGSLCAQHCLNALLQGAYFTAVDLATIGRQLDDVERQRMAEGDINSEEFQKFLKEPSSNMDDSGYFSIQVICKALEVWNLTTIPYLSPRAQSARLNPVNEKAFICNLQGHWFTIRKLGRQWFNLNSVASGPELISETYLSLFLTQLQNEGYSIFVVHGLFPDCESDQMLSLIPVDPTKVKSTSTRGKSLNTVSHQDTAAKPVDVDEVRRKREKFYSSRFGQGSTEPSPQSSHVENISPNGETEEEMLQRAMALSLEQT